MLRAATGNHGLPDDLVTWIERVAHGRVVTAERRPGGARKEAWFVDLARADHPDRVDKLFLRYDRSDPRRTADPWTLHREATVYLALQDTDVPVPRVLGIHPVHQAMLAERVHGENWFSHITDADERSQTARDFIAALAALHRLDPSTLDLPAFPRPTTVPDALTHELDEWDHVIAARGGDPDPALAFTLDWLRRNIPSYAAPVVLVQGDTGPGNFMYADGRVVAIVDWELAHLGDPMDDIAWLSLRATQEPLPDFPALLRLYSQLSGHAIDDARVHYYRVMAEAKLQVMAHGRRGGGANSDAGNTLIYGLLHRRLWFEALAQAVGLELTPAEVPPERAPDPLYAAVLAQLRDVVVPRSSDALVIARVKGIARVVKYLEQADAHGAFFEACELDDLAALLGARPSSIAEGRRAVAGAARLTDEDYLGYMWRRIARETELARPAMGRLADRHWPELH